MRQIILRRIVYSSSRYRPCAHRQGTSRATSVVVVEVKVLRLPEDTDPGDNSCDEAEVPGAGSRGCPCRQGSSPLLVVAGVNNKVVLLVLDKCRGTRPGGSSAFRVHGLGFRT